MAKFFQRSFFILGLVLAAQAWGQEEEYSEPDEGAVYEDPYTSEEGDYPAMDMPTDNADPAADSAGGYYGDTTAPTEEGTDGSSAETPAEVVDSSAASPAAALPTSAVPALTTTPAPAPGSPAATTAAANAKKKKKGVTQNQAAIPEPKKEEAAKPK